MNIARLSAIGQDPDADDDHRQARHDDVRVADAIGIAADERPRHDDRQAEDGEIQRPRRHAD